MTDVRPRVMWHKKTISTFDWTAVGLGDKIISNRDHVKLLITIDKLRHFYSICIALQQPFRQQKYTRQQPISLPWLHVHAHLPRTHCLLPAAVKKLQKGGAKMSGTGKGHDYERDCERTLAFSTNVMHQWRSRYHSCRVLLLKLICSCS